MRFIPINLCVICVATAIVYPTERVHVDMMNAEDGFLVKSLYEKGVNHSRFEEIANFVVLNKHSSHPLQAKFSPFNVYKTIPEDLSDDRSHGSRFAVLDGLNFHVIILDYPTEVSKSKLRALFHFIPIKPHSTNRKSSNRNHLWCAQFFVKYRSQQLVSSCVLQEVDQSCVTSLSIPPEWWTSGRGTLTTSYSVQQVNNKYRCIHPTNSLIPATRYQYNIPKTSRITYLETIELQNRSAKFNNIGKEDVIIKIPNGPVIPGSTFYVPVQLAQGANLETFIVRVRARSGIKVVGAESVPGGNWHVTIELNNRQKSATLTADVLNLAKLRKNPRKQTVMRVRFEVDSSLTDPNHVCRVIWSIDRGYHTRPRSRYFVSSPEPKFISRFPVYINNPQKLIALLSVSDIINTALITGKRESYRLLAYLITEDSRLRDVTNRSMCYSSSLQSLKVTSDCGWVYVDGTETSGIYNMSVIVKYGGHTAFANLNVWIPERRLTIQLSDYKLNAIKRWRIPVRKSERLYPGWKLSDKQQTQCHAKYQESAYNVYTRFHIDIGSRRLFYAHRRAYFRITNLVRHGTRIADMHVAEIRSGLIRGIQPGRTEIQVLSAYGRVLGAAELEVVRDRVYVTHVSAFLVSGISVNIAQGTSIPNTIEARVHFDDTLRHKNEKGIISMDVHYSDKSVIQLTDIDPESYKLIWTVVKPSHVRLFESGRPRISGVASGRGKYIMFALQSPDVCRKKAHRSLATGDVDIKIRLGNSSIDKKALQSDASYHLERQENYESFNGRNIYTVTLPEDKDFSHKKASSDFNNVTLKVLEPAAQRHSIHVKKAMTPFEIGMYVLLAVFSVATTIFIIHCIVFAYRRTHKRLPKQSSPVAANDWVWLGRATLERNSIMDTRCSQVLMPEEDFNGNRISYSSQLFDRAISRESSVPSTAPSSNRNSQISTYPGNECSIQITSNPLESDSPHDCDSQMSTHSSYISSSRRSFHFPDRDTLRSMSETDHEWDYESMGMTYDQLVDYFGNLKESRA